MYIYIYIIYYYIYILYHLYQLSHTFSLFLFSLI